MSDTVTRPLTPRQQQALDYLRAVHDAEGRVLGSSELGRLMGITSQAADRLIDKIRIAGRMPGAEGGR